MALGPYSYPGIFELLADPVGYVGPYSDPNIFILEAPNLIPPLVPYSDPVTFELLADAPPEIFPYSDPQTINTSSVVWRLAADTGWVDAELVIA